jgi:Protein of unknown function (DUF4232)
MNLLRSSARKLVLFAALGSAAAFAAGCGTTSSGGSPSRTVTVTVPASAGATATATTTPAGTPTSVPLAECTTSDLRVKVGSSNGAAGTIYYSIDLTNISTSNCFLQGYPGVSLVSAGTNAGSQIGADAKRDPVVPAKQITLAPGSTANAQLGVAEAGNFPASSCHQVTAHWLKVFPPDQTVAAYTPLTTQTCSSTSVPTMHIAALTAGA